MPLVNFCRKCRAETPLGEACPYCGAKLAQTGEQISFGQLRRPVKEWFAWNQILRIVLPVWVLVWTSLVVLEGAFAGTAEAASMIRELTHTMLILLAQILALTGLLLFLQGQESVHVVMDKQGLQVRTYVVQNRKRLLYSRFISEQAAEKLAEEDERPELPGLVLVKSVSVPWNAVSRVRFWREGNTVLFFRPSFWQAASVYVPVQEWQQTEEFIRKKMKRNKKAKVQPAQKKGKNH